VEHLEGFLCKQLIRHQSPPSQAAPDGKTPTWRIPLDAATLRFQIGATSWHPAGRLHNARNSGRPRLLYSRPPPSPGRENRGEPAVRVRTAISLLLVALAALLACDDESTTGPHSPAAPDSSQYAVIQTTMGDITIELNPEKAPLTVANFRLYAAEHFYDGLIVHRVIANFMDQAGAYREGMVFIAPTHDPIVNEAGNGLTNDKYTVAMARTSVVNSATSQFFINAKDNAFLNHKDDTPQGYGYAVFGRVVKGMDVVDAINAVPTGVVNGVYDVPLTPVVMTRVVVHRALFEPHGSR
jgi:cyclophilin family peptidyl-prolyl cis-trans isomerase